MSIIPKPGSCDPAKAVLFKKTRMTALTHSTFTSREVNAINSTLELPVSLCRVSGRKQIFSPIKRARDIRLNTFGVSTLGVWRRTYCHGSNNQKHPAL